MNKKKAISIITKAARLYHENLEDQKVLFIYGIPSEIRKQLEDGNDTISGFSFYETVFHRSNFLHLTGVKLNKATVDSSIHFYEKCLDGRLAEKDFYLSSDGSTDQKLEVIENMMNIKKVAAMIGDFTDMGPKLFSEKIAGNTCACKGFLKDSYSKLNVPNTLLKKDIREVTSKPQQKIYVIMSKSYTAEKYAVVEKCDKIIRLENIDGITEYVYDLNMFK